jgi:hypothetical protein
VGTRPPLGRSNSLQRGYRGAHFELEQPSGRVWRSHFEGSNSLQGGCGGAHFGLEQASGRVWRSHFEGSNSLRGRYRAAHRGLDQPLARVGWSRASARRACAKNELHVRRAPWPLSRIHFLGHGREEEDSQVSTSSYHKGERQQMDAARAFSCGERNIT